jgi:hypothetical protein
MANIPIPQQGQPIDYQYIYQIVDALNGLSTKVTSKFSESKFDNGTIKETHRLNDLAVVAGYVEVTNNTNVNAKTELPFTYNFNNNYKYPPVVTATPVLIKNTNAGRDSSVVINDVSTSRVTGYVSFNGAGTEKASVGVNIIAIGIPNI